MTKVLIVILFLPFARLIISRKCTGLIGQVLIAVCAFRSSRDGGSGIFPDIPRLLMRVRYETHGGPGGAQPPAHLSGKIPNGRHQQQPVNLKPVCFMRQTAGIA
jgi:hypothetical protein